MTKVTGQAPPRVKMTIRVYTVNADGAITKDRGAVMTVPHGFEPARESMNTAMPPCACRFHRTGEKR
ncbi:hypothetical protein ABT124_17845 [Streptomyces sp. NPDC001982]|uniref:hypothetical protein n=1 Tax=Streptomyces sp. NPDC001982 TaxID=3154405 RepID=UPI00332794FD